MTDKLLHLLLDALGKAVVQPDGIPLFGTKSAPGLFPSSVAARPAADHARAENLIRQLAIDPKGKSDRDLFVATDAGREFYLRETRPRQVLEDLTRAMEKRHGQIDEMLKVARETQGAVASLKMILAAVASGFDSPPPKPSSDEDPRWLADLRSRLNEWMNPAGGGCLSGDCPLPELFRGLRAAHPTLTIGRFHDGLRELHDRAKVYLHPWTGPLYALPEPAFALLVGHEIAYYASLRQNAGPSERHTNGVLV